MPKFIKHYDEALDLEVCEQIIQRFDADPAREQGKVSGNAGAELDLAGKQTTELVLPPDSWGDVISVLQTSLSQFLGRYQADVKFLAGSDHKDLHAEPLRVKKYDPGGQFHWHIDDNSAQNQTRVLAAQWYFNNVDSGGHTEFEDQDTRIKPVAGRIAFFPVGWTYRHRGAPPKSGPKYVCTTFVHRIF
ncbi:MAG: 2OG-Fe(II) oxygenase [Pseudomonadota bacterium]